MDDFDEAHDGDGPILQAIVFGCHVFGVAVFFITCCRTCCSKAPPEGGEAEAPEVTDEHLQPRKRLMTSYILWLSCGPIANAHHFYLGRIVHGLVGVWTMNFLCFGWLLDAVLLPLYVHRANARCTAPTAPYDSSLRRLCRLPMLAICVVLFGLVVILYLPTGLQYVGAVDLDRMAAQTEANPYDVLDIARGADLAEAKSAYRKASLRWHPDRNIGCGKECEKKMAEIGKAFDLIKKRRASTVDWTWDDWLKERRDDWWNILHVFTAEQSNDSQEPKAKSDL